MVTTNGTGPWVWHFVHTFLVFFSHLSPATRGRFLTTCDRIGRCFGFLQILSFLFVSAHVCVSEMLRLFSGRLSFGKYFLYLPLLLSKEIVLSKSILLAATLKMVQDEALNVRSRSIDVVSTPHQE